MRNYLLGLVAIVALLAWAVIHYVGGAEHEANRMQQGIICSDRMNSVTTAGDSVIMYDRYPICDTLRKETK